MLPSLGSPRGGWEIAPGRGDSAERRTGAGARTRVKDVSDCWGFWKLDASRGESSFPGSDVGSVVMEGRGSGMLLNFSRTL